jgi:hypothetical protein
VAALPVGTGNVARTAHRPFILLRVPEPLVCKNSRVQARWGEDGGRVDVCMGGFGCGRSDGGDGGVCTHVVPCVMWCDCAV